MLYFTIMLVILCLPTPTLQAAIAQTTPPAATQPTTTIDPSKDGPADWYDSLGCC